MSVALIAVAFGLVGCAAKEKPVKVEGKDVAAHSQKCKGKKCHPRHRHVGKLGEEKMEQDTAK